MATEQVTVTATDRAGAASASVVATATIGPSTIPLGPMVGISGGANVANSQALIGGAKLMRVFNPAQAKAAAAGTQLIYSDDATSWQDNIFGGDPALIAIAADHLTADLRDDAPHIWAPLHEYDKNAGADPAHFQAVFANAPRVLALVNTGRRNKIRLASCLTGMVFGRAGGMEPYYVPGVDLLLWDTYDPRWFGTQKDYAKAKAKPWGLAETGINAGDASPNLPTNTDALSVARMRTDMATLWGFTDWPLSVYCHFNGRGTALDQTPPKPLTAAYLRQVATTGKL